MIAAKSIYPTESTKRKRNKTRRGQHFRINRIIKWKQKGEKTKEERQVTAAATTKRSLQGTIVN